MYPYRFTEASRRDPESLPLDSSFVDDSTGRVADAEGE